MSTTTLSNITYNCDDYIPITTTTTGTSIKIAPSFEDCIIKNSTTTPITIYAEDYTKMYRRIIGKRAMGNKDDIIAIKEIVPEKVYKFYFNDGTIEKTVRLENETHNLKYAAFIALSKKLYRKTLTFEGILYKVNNELIFSKQYNKMIDKAIKLFIKDKKDKEKRIKEIKEAKERKEQLALKKHNKRLKERQVKNKELAEAIAAAMNNKED